jgi:hypothetical protein
MWTGELAVVADVVVVAAAPAAAVETAGDCCDETS